MGRLDGKVALISGGARGQGALEAELFVAEGASVVFGDVLDDEGRSVERRITEAGGEAVYVHLDVTSDDDWTAAVDTAEARFGKLDVLVNNAGIANDEKIEETSEELWERIMLVNAKGVFLGTRKALPAMRRAGGGSIINVSSIAGILGRALTGSAYSASKGAVRTFTKTTAIQHASGAHPLQLHPPRPGRHPHARRHQRQPRRPRAAHRGSPPGPPRPLPRHSLRRTIPRLRRIRLDYRHRTDNRRRHYGEIAGNRDRSHAAKSNPLPLRGRVRSVLSLPKG